MTTSTLKYNIQTEVWTTSLMTISHDLKLTLASHQCTGHRWINPSMKYAKDTDTGYDSIPFQQFQVLFNSLFKVLFIFPSRYLFAIGLAPIFSFRWNLPPTLSCNPKQLDSKKACRTYKLYGHRREYHPPCCPLPRDLSQIIVLTTASLDYNSPYWTNMEILSLSLSRFTRRY